MDIREIAGFITVDIRKAFDYVDHKILLKRMQEQFGVRNLELRWFQSYLTNRTQQLWKYIYWVPQGSILEPLMFLLYINDLPECLQNTTSGMYADDTQIYASLLVSN